MADGSTSAVTHQRETERALRLVPRQAGGGIQDMVQLVTLGQLTFFGGDAAGDLLQLFSVGQLVLDDDEVLSPVRSGC